MAEASRSYRMGKRADDVERTRGQIIRAARGQFLTRPYGAVTIAAVASDAGVSQQTLLNHFGSKERLLLAVTEVLAPELLELRGAVRPGDAEGAVRGLMRQYEQFGDANIRIVSEAGAFPELAATVAAGRADHSQWLAQVFGANLPEDHVQRERALAALYAVTDVGTWKLLRRDLAKSRGETAAILQSMIRAVLSAAFA